MLAMLLNLVAAAVLGLLAALHAFVRATCGQLDCIAAAFICPAVELHKRVHTTHPLSHYNGVVLLPLPGTPSAAKSQYGAAEFSTVAGAIAGLGSMTNDSQVAVNAINSNTRQGTYTNTDAGLAQW